MRKAHGKADFFGSSSPFPGFGPLVGDWLANDAVYDGSNIVLTIPNSYPDGGSGEMVSVGNQSAPPPNGGQIFYQSSGWSVDSSPAVFVQASVGGLGNNGCTLLAELDVATRYPAGNYTSFVVFYPTTNPNYGPVLGVGEYLNQSETWYEDFQGLLAYVNTNGQSAVSGGNVQVQVPQIWTAIRVTNSPTPITLRRRLTQSGTTSTIFAGNPQYYGVGAITVRDVVLGPMGPGQTAMTGFYKRALFYSDILTSENLDAAEQALADLYLPA